METSKLKKFAQYARRSLIEQVSSKLAQVIKEESAERRELPNVVAKLESQLKQKGKEQLVEQAAYIWFNRFCALRFMDVNQYNRIMVLSPLEGQFQPEILAEAKAGHIDDSVVNDKTREKIFGLLNGSIKSRDGQSEAYHLLIVAVCNDYHRIMPYLFERIEDYMELLMPDDLLSGNSILAYTREAMTPEACESVECIGWLYQFYISEKKDQVFEGLKKNKKITPENIPAATQLFTPDWIVRYLVENSLGRLWMLNNPSSKVIEQMDYYIKPVEQETDFLKIRNPEEIKVCDPACGSGHMLTYAYDLLYAIYLDAEYDPVNIPELILTKNLYGIEIDERATELAAFALSMKAIKGDPKAEGNNRRRFFRNPIKPNICRLENITFNDNELNEYFDFVGRDLFTQDLRTTLKEFEEADNFGSLIQPTLKNAEDVLSVLKAKDVSGQLFLAETHQRVLRVIDQADYLSQKYHIVAANPPYMGSNGMNGCLSSYAKENYPDSKSDLFAMFIERDLKLALKFGYSAMINMQSWMFLSSFENLRSKLLNESAISSMVHLGSRAFDSIGGEIVSTTAYILKNSVDPEWKADYIRLVDGKTQTEKEADFLRLIRNRDSGFVFKASVKDFTSIPGNPISYWISDKARALFSDNKSIGDVAAPRRGLATNDNPRFLRYWFEISYNRICFGAKSRELAKSSGLKWFPYNKGGSFRRWYGNNEFVVNWENDGAEMFELATKLYGSPTRTIKNLKYYFMPGASWSMLGSSDLSVRYMEHGFIFDQAADTVFVNDEKEIPYFLALLNSKVCEYLKSVINPSMNTTAGVIALLPFIRIEQAELINEMVGELIQLAKRDWDSSELSWNFKLNPLLENRQEYRLSSSVDSYIEKSYKTVERVKSLEEKINKLIINGYDLGQVLDFKVDEKEISLNANPYFLYGDNINHEQREQDFKFDLIKDLISYAVGSMFGRYSLEKEGLILKNQGDSSTDDIQNVPKARFVPDYDNVIPIINFESNWFEDDISERFKKFLKITFGEEHFAENLAFVENAIGKDIKKYFVKDFYADHVKRYQKRPIYWLFSSPKGTFNALIYVHRYRSDTVSVVLNDYLREFRTKLQARKESYEQVEISASASPKDKTDAIKAIDKINKALDEVNGYERDILYPLAGQKIEIDLDDGVKVNYPKFGKALKNITGLS